ncbi:hypothetical protein BHM03_00023754 [Ensete ventricosum]|nr:hypothetical protein BHM03_00023754 [Ensete ventricosum]
MGQRSPMRAATEDWPVATVVGKHRREGSAGGEREMVAGGKSRGRRRAWLRQWRLWQREEKAVRSDEGYGRGAGDWERWVRLVPTARE